MVAAIELDDAGPYLELGEAGGRIRLEGVERGEGVGFGQGEAGGGGRGGCRCCWASGRVGEVRTGSWGWGG